MSSVWNIAGVRGIEKRKHSKLYTFFESIFFGVIYISSICMSLVKVNHIVKFDVKGMDKYNLAPKEGQQIVLNDNNIYHREVK